MNLLIEDRQSKISSNLTEFFKSILTTSLDHLGYDRDVEISLLLVEDDFIKGLNRQHRGIDEATDVLSFPMLSPGMEPGETDSLEGDRNKDTGDLLLGDIVISTERAISQAEEYGHSIERELGFLMVHGLLHLLGYDHDAGVQGEREMFRLQDEILAKLDLTRT